jgi:hypothetical protein
LSEKENKMAALRLYNLFISHAWPYDDYDRLVDLLDSKRNFRWRNYSVSMDSPFINTDDSLVGGKQLKQALDKQIRPSNCVLVIAGMELNHRIWLQTELEIAHRYDKPIIGVRPRGKVAVPRLLEKYAVEIVNWNRDSIVEAIRSLAF